MFLSRRASFGLISAAVAACIAIFLFEYAGRYLRVRSNPHHWYAVDLYVPYTHRSTVLEHGPSGITAEGVLGPYNSKAQCQNGLAQQSDEYGHYWTCRQMTDADASAIKH